VPTSALTDSQLPWKPSFAEEFRSSAGKTGKVPRFDGRSLHDWARLTKGKPPLGHPLPSFTPAEVLQRSTPDDLWMVIGGIVIDCTQFQHFHPGGEAILRKYGGRDVTELYEGYHRWVALDQIMGGTCVVGTVVTERRE